MLRGDGDDVAAVVFLVFHRQCAPTPSAKTGINDAPLCADTMSSPDAHTANFANGQHRSDKVIKGVVRLRRESLMGLDIQNNFLPPDSIVDLCNELRAVSGLERLNLSINPVMHAIRDVGELVQSKPTFQALVVHECRLGNDGARILAQLLARHPSLDYVNVNSNGIEEAAAMDLMVALGTCDNMKYLHIWGNGLDVDRMKAVHGVLGLKFELCI